MKNLLICFVIVLLTGCGFSSKWMTPIKQNDVAAIQSTLDGGGNPNELSEGGDTPLLLAAFHNKPKIVKQLLSAGANPNQLNKEGDTSLIIATANGYSDVVKELIDGGANVNAKGRFGLTPLHWLSNKPENFSAAKMSNIAKYLISSGADLYAVNQTGGTVLHNPLDSGVLEVILELGGDQIVDFRDLDGRTPIFHQINANSIRVLLKAGAQDSALDNMGLTALHMHVWLISQNNWPIQNLQNYLDANIDPNITNLQGMTPLEYARHFNHFLVINALENYKQKYSDPLTDFYTCEESKINEEKASCYTSFIERHPESNQRKKAESRLVGINKKIRIAKKNAHKKRLSNQACKLKNNEWIYLSKSCKGSFAHGQGEAVNEDKNLRYVGQFKNGLRVQGEIFAYGKLMYDGPLKSERPHGTGTCIHEGEPEECKFYKGKRTDVLYKQRIEFAKQREMMASTEKRINDSLKQTESKIDEKLANIQVQSGTGYQGASAKNLVMDAVKKKAAEEAADFLFDQLF